MRSSRILLAALAAASVLLWSVLKFKYGGLGLFSDAELLLILVANDRWAKLAFGPLLSHGGTRGREWWIARVQEAGFQVLEDGTSPVTLYVLARRL